MKIEDILARRSDLSTFLVHLCRDHPDRTARECLESILQARELRAYRPLGQAVQKLKEAEIDTACQEAVCFTETPLEHTILLCHSIEGRACDFEPYGIAITKKQARKVGINPVWYLDTTPSGHDWLTNHVDNLINIAIDEHRNNAKPFEESSIARLTPFMERMGTIPGHSRKEFWWEREWRYVGNFHLPSRYLVLCPEENFDSMRECVDEWDAPPKFWHRYTCLSRGAQTARAACDGALRLGGAPEH